MHHFPQNSSIGIRLSPLLTKNESPTGLSFLVSSGTRIWEEASFTGRRFLSLPWGNQGFANFLFTKLITQNFSDLFRIAQN
jgi:hypothetical protein